jgi:lysophospholipase L1-like esterase
VRSLAVAAAALVGLVAAACSAGGQAAAPPSAAGHASPTPPKVIYAALGASETAGIGTTEPRRDSFPQQLLARLGPASVLYNLGIPGETTAAALNDELPAALSEHPDLATVFFNVDDMVAGVPAADFQARMDQIVGSLRAGGHTRVLVANVPPLDQLPAFQACEGGFSCPIKTTPIPSPAQIDALAAAYNAAIAQVAAAHGATVVDLWSGANTLAGHPEYLAPDGFHPSSAGAAVLAQAFYQAWRSAR